MRKIEKLMNKAISQQFNWSHQNTSVHIECNGNPHGKRAEIYLHGHHIADYWYDSQELDVDVRTLSRWPTVTTKSRLRALGANVFTKDYTTYLDGKAV